MNSKPSAQQVNQNYDVVIIGAGPSGSVAASLLVADGLSVLILEKQHFPRFSIGESLLPQCMEFLKEAGLEQALDRYAEEYGFQFKNGAAFHKQGKNSAFDFTEKFSAGRGTTYQVKRAIFDKLLADETEKKQVEIRYGHQVDSVLTLQPEVCLEVSDDDGSAYKVRAKFLLDGSGFGRVLPKLLKLELPSEFPVRHSYFSHFKDGIDCPEFDRDKILITVNPNFSDVWYWLIPFSDGSASVGVVGLPERFDASLAPIDTLMNFINQDPNLQRLMKNATPIGEARSIKGYSADVTKLWGDNFALLGNAGEFLDPVFSSGVTIAMKSASLAAPLVKRQLQGNSVDWESEYAKPLKFGVDTFRCFVEAWYDESFQNVVYHDQHDDAVRRMISSILAGYAWDEKNPYVEKSVRRLSVLAEICQPS
ncbi:NAD(P)/FAD-dependent oxidoreductase [Cognaticolwellia aestuarii]|uniref:NAD(P)/FAD-dependent oxidoreductase n=1 Tax=Cognaticolwellia aestuarii TaxID=329993 RepID=UPI0015C413DB|nr:NAD(P)/FAD-dependent oxidoreductase [Cognaticolwellia aestuarii]